MLSVETSDVDRPTDLTIPKDGLKKSFGWFEGPKNYPNPLTALVDG